VDLDARRAEMETWIAGSRRTRGRVALGGAVGALFGVVVIVFVHAEIGAAVVMTALAAAGCGAWITTAHILTFKGQIKELDSTKIHGRPIAVRQGRGRHKR
jgi:hypothetical protein